MCSAVSPGTSQQRTACTGGHAPTLWHLPAAGVAWAAALTAVTPTAVSTCTRSTAAVHVSCCGSAGWWLSLRHGDRRACCSCSSANPIAAPVLPAAMYCAVRMSKGSDRSPPPLLISSLLRDQDQGAGGLPTKGQEARCAQLSCRCMWVGVRLHVGARTSAVHARA